MSRFEVGKIYEGYDSGFAPIKVLRRTDKTIWVDNGTNEWKMRVRVSDSGAEFAVDSSVPARWRDAFTYDSRWEVRE